MRTRRSRHDLANAHDLSGPRGPLRLAFPLLPLLLPCLCSFSVFGWGRPARPQTWPPWLGALWGPQESALAFFLILESERMHGRPFLGLGTGGASVPLGGDGSDLSCSGSRPGAGRVTTPPAAWTPCPGTSPRGPVFLTGMDPMSRQVKSSSCSSNES